MRHLITFIFFLFLTQLSKAGSITGKITDEKGEPIFGASIQIDSTIMGAKTDMDGKFTIKNVNDGKYNITISYVSYDKKHITDIEVKNGTAEFLLISLEKSSKKLKEVTVKTSAKKESVQSLLMHQKNLAVVSDGISGEMIKKTADRNTGDVLKRVSGVTIADNKFAVIRGLADRYNLAMLNGDILPSSESNRKAFSFDIFPSNLLERITILKTATPDRPAEFSGGIIELNTKDAPNDNFVSVQLGTGLGTISTFNTYTQAKKSNTDWLGFDKTLRVLPTNFPSTEMFYSNSAVFTKTQRYDATKMLNNNWELIEKKSAPLNRNFQLSAGCHKKIKKNTVFSVLGALSYNRSLKTNTLIRSDLAGSVVTYKYNDTVYNDNVLIGALLNASFKINDRNKINFRNTYTSNSEDRTILRSGDFIEAQQEIKSNAAWYTTNQLLSSQLTGEHLVTKQKIKIRWNVSQNSIERAMPDLRKFHSYKNYDDSVYRAYIPVGKASPFYSGTFNSTISEKIKNGQLDFTVPYKILHIDQQLKFGTFIQNKTRIYDARVLGYKVANLAQYNSDLELTPQSSLFSLANIGDKGVVIDDITSPNDNYHANSNLKAFYLSNDNKIGEKIRLVWGVRLEDFEQELITGEKKKGDLVITKHNTDFLPSLNFTYLLNKKTNLRFCASQTLSRPEFRELSPSTFYDYNMLLLYQGQPNLEQTKIQNYDVRYEYFMGSGEMISASAFYKHFEKPIEVSIPQGTRTVQYTNSPDANLYGLELEFRKSFSFLTTNKKSFLNHLSCFGNFAYIKSVVSTSFQNINTGLDSIVKRRMQGQSPYIINMGLNYTNPEKNIGVSVLFNRIGERIFAVGNGNDMENLYEAPRNVLDFSFNKKIKKNIDIKFTIADILHNAQLFYYNTTAQNVADGTKLSYQKNTDFIYSKQRNNTNFGLSITYNLSK